MTRWTLQISSGVGPVEVRSFVGKLARALEAELTARGLPVVTVAFHGEPDAPASASLSIACESRPLVDDLLGTHEWVARSPARGRRSRKRWFAGVTLHHEAAVDDEIDAGDVVVTVCRSGGAGGQHVNKTSSAVQLHHVPTGIRVRCENERSQLANRAGAMSRLAALLAERAAAARGDAIAKSRLEHYRVVRGVPVRSWTFEP